MIDYTKEDFKKLCPFTCLREYCYKNCALYDEEYNGCCIANFSKEIEKTILKVIKSK